MNRFSVGLFVGLCIGMHSLGVLAEEKAIPMEDAPRLTSPPKIDEESIALALKFAAEHPGSAKDLGLILGLPPNPTAKEVGDSQQIRAMVTEAFQVYDGDSPLDKERRATLEPEFRKYAAPNRGAIYLRDYGRTGQAVQVIVSADQLRQTIAEIVKKHPEVVTIHVEIPTFFVQGFQPEQRAQAKADLGPKYVKVMGHSTALNSMTGFTPISKADDGTLGILWGDEGGKQLGTDFTWTDIKYSKADKVCRIWTPRGKTTIDVLKELDSSTVVLKFGPRNAVVQCSSSQYDAWRKMGLDVVQVDPTSSPAPTSNTP